MKFNRTFAKTITVILVAVATILCCASIATYADVDEAVNGQSTVQTVELKESEGLVYGIYSGYYAVKGIGTCTDTTIVIPETYNNLPVKMIWQNAFSGNKEITSVVLHSGITQIGNSAFEGCSNLRTVVIPEGLTTLGQFAFAACTKLQSITLPGTLSQIYNYSFDNCIGLNEVIFSEGATSIGGSMFSGCISLSRITIPSTLTTVGGIAFYNCSKLSTVIVRSPSVAAAATAATSCGSLFQRAEDIYVDSSIDSVGSYITSNFPYVSEKNLDGIIYSHYSSTPNFYPTAPIQTWNISYTPSDNVKAYLYQDPDDIAGYALVIVGSGNMGNTVPWSSYSANINKVTIGEGVTCVGQGAFSGFSKLKSISLPDTINKIYNYAFENCTSLAEVRLSNNLTSIGNYAFDGCTALTEITIPSSVTTMGIASSEGCFSGCENLKRVVIDSATVAQSATSSWSLLRYADEVYVNGSVTSVGSGISDNFPFESTKLLNDTPYVLYSKNYSVKNDLFDTEPIEIWNASATTADQVFGILYADPDNAGGYVLVVEGKGNMGWTTQNAPWASYLTKINKVCILEGVTGVNAYAFRNCSSLAEISISATVTTIGERAFYGCSSLKSISIPNSVTSMGAYVFYGCKGLETVTLSNSLTEIAANSFQNCSSLTEIVIPDNVKSIGASAFYGCTNLVDVNLRDSNITSIGQYAFRNCKKLMYADLPDSLTSLGDQSFDGCAELVYIRIPEGISSLKSTIFYGCSKEATVLIDNPSVIASVSSLGLSPKTFAFNVMNAPTISDYYAKVLYSITEDIEYDGRQYKLHSQCTHSWKTVKVINERVACQRDGLTRYMCELCYVMKDVTTPKHIEGDWVVVNEGSCFIDGFKCTACITCGDLIQSEKTVAMGHVVSKNALFIANNSPYPFVLDGDTYGSTNRPSKSKSVFTITAAHDYVLDLEYFVSSCIDSGSILGDHLIIKHNDAVLAEVSGVSIVWKSISISLKEGDVVSIEYAKSDACYDGNHAAYFKINSDGVYHISVNDMVVESCDNPIICSGCNEIVKKIDHEYGDWTVESPATCIADGLKCKKCINCQTAVYETIEKLGHELIDREGRAPTCTEIGWDAYEICSRCGYNTYSEKAALGHNIIEHGAKDKTCTEVGWYGYETCSRVGCDYTTYVEIPASHSPVTVNAVAPTCTKTGLTIGKRCSECPTVIVPQETIPALGHDPISHEGRAPTCTEIGWDAYETCSRCDYTTYAERAATGHSVGEWQIGTPAKCQTDGIYSHYFCSVCERYLDEAKNIIDDIVIPAKGHSYGEWKTQDEPTCETNGEKFRSCSVCYDDQYIQRATVSKLGHKWKKIKELSNEVKTHYECTRCEETMDVPVGADENKYIQYIRCDTDYVFYVTCDYNGSKDRETYIRENLTISNTNMEHAYGEADARVKTAYSLTYVGDNVYKVSAVGGYTAGATYRVRVFGDVEFRDYWQPILKLFVKSPDYVPMWDFDGYITDFKPDMGWLKLFNWNFTINPGDWFFGVGYYGRIKAIRPNGDGSVDVNFDAYPDLPEHIRDLLDEIAKHGGFKTQKGYLGYDSLIEKWNSEETFESFKSLIENNLSFMAFKEIAGEAAMEYLVNKGIEAASFSNEHMSFKPILERSEKDEDAVVIGMSIEFKYNVKKKGAKAEDSDLGTIVVKLVVKNETKIEVNMGIDAFDDALLTAYMDLTQDATASVELTANFHMQYELKDTEYPFIINHKRKIVHRYYCQYIEQTKYTGKLEAAQYDQVLKVLEDKYELCELCQPANEEFIKSTTFKWAYVKEDGKTFPRVHREGCLHIADSTKYETLTDPSLLKDADYCDWCMVTKTERDFETYIKNSLKYADWGSVIDSIKGKLEETGAKDLIESVASGLGGKEKEEAVGIKLGSFQPFNNVYFAAAVDVYFVFDFDLEAWFKLEITQDYTHCARLEYNIMPNILKKAPVNVDQWFEDDGRTITLELAGKLKAHAGVKLDIEAGILGIEPDGEVFKPLIGFSFDIEAGVYVQLTGIIKYSVTTDEDGSVDEEYDYGAARFETGLYVEFQASIKFWKYYFPFFETDGELPLAVMGYDKAYYGYTNDEGSLVIHSDKPLNDSISVKYFDLDDMSDKTDDSFSIGGVDGLYSVTYKLEEGKYCEIVDGRLLIDPAAPHDFSDVLYITIEGEASGWELRSGDEEEQNALYNLRPYTIELKIYNHNYRAEGNVTVPPTCQNEGTIEYVCRDCGHVRTESLAIVDHKFNPEATVHQPTCTEKGYTVSLCVYSGCKEEKKTYTSEALGHLADMVNSFKATCEDNGYTEIACSRCETVIAIIDEVPAFGHDFADSDNWIVIDQGSCTSPAVYRRPCMNDGCKEYVDEESIEDGHKLIYSDETSAKAPTCTEEGWEAYGVCECEYNNKVTIGPKGHTEIIDKAVAPTCTETGLSEGKHCSECGAVLVSQEILPSLDHDYVIHEAKAPTCLEIGWKAYETCSRCDYTTYEELGATGHNYVYSYTEKKYVCEGCGIMIAMGDVNGDGSITNYDILLMYRYIYNPQEYPISVLESADVTCDGSVTNADVLVMYRYIFNPLLYPLEKAVSD